MTFEFSVNLKISRCTAVNPATCKREQAFLIAREINHNGAYNFDYDEKEYLFFNAYFARAEFDHPECVIEALQVFLSEADFGSAPVIAHENDFVKYQIIMED